MQQMLVLFFAMLLQTSCMCMEFFFVKGNSSRFQCFGRTCFCMSFYWQHQTQNALEILLTVKVLGQQVKFLLLIMHLEIVEQNVSIITHYHVAL